ncbi:MAG TPA: metallophosphoesterase family protein, partial [Terriglobales bacterium]|nr:metallophosphoesterase family protein [Terriglobales bacterium]
MRRWRSDLAIGAAVIGKLQARIFASLLLLAASLANTAGAATTELIARGSVWKYLDNGSDAGSAWRGLDFDDSGWSSGPAQLGYGDGDEATVVSYGPSASNKFVTTYFRRRFEVADPAAFARVDLALLRDDGAVVYLNGSEVIRTNLSTGPIGYRQLASAAAAGSDEWRYLAVAVPPPLLRQGDNVVAVEIHQSSAGSSDISFDLGLRAADTAVIVTRGPYLQLGTPTSVVVRWRTDAPVESVVRYGTSAAVLDRSAVVAGERTEHAVELKGLEPATTYYYAIGAGGIVLAGGDGDHAFTTAPAAGSSTDARIWVIGDSGTGGANARAVRDAFDRVNDDAPPDLWLMLGDNAYEDGTDAEYQAAVFDMYPRQLRRAVLWPTLGNHDAVAAESATQSGPYYDIFTLPAQAEAGGVPSGTEAYYSFDYGNVHFVCLDSQESDRSPNGAMLSWLEDDLLANDAHWTIAFWHHPPYSKGSHNSDAEQKLIDMRQNALPILESFGVDLVLAGHSHSYERSYLLDGHYGSSVTLQPEMVLDDGDGRPQGDGAYTKNPPPAPSSGAVYAVAGSSGQISVAPLNHPAMFVSLLSL